MSLLKLSHLKPVRPADEAKPRTLLLIDSDFHSQKVLQLLLQSHWQLLTTASAAQTMALLEQHTDTRDIQVILCEQSLTDSDGATLMAQIQQIIPNAIAILFGSNPIAADDNQRQPANVYQRLSKPLRPAQLFDYLNQAQAVFHRRLELISQREKLSIEIQQISEQLSDKKLQMAQTQQSLDDLYHL